MPNFMPLIVTQFASPPLPGQRERAGTLRPFLAGVAGDQLGDAAGELDGELPLLGDAAGDVTTGALDWPLGALPNQSQRVKPKNSRIRTSSAIRAAAMPA